MIAITKDRTQLPDIQGAKYYDNLEALTGADMLFSALDLPANKPALIAEHLEAKAVLVQIKLGHDLAASVGQRLHDSLMKMREVAPRQGQRVLQFVGTLGRDSEGNAIIDGRKVSENIPGVSWKACNSSMRNWIFYGGSVYPFLSLASQIPEWAIETEKAVKQAYDNPTATFWPDKPSLFDNDNDSDPLRFPVKITDWRVPLSFLIGPKKAQIMYDSCNGHGGYAYYILSDAYLWDKLPKGIYESDARKFRERMNLKDGEILTVNRPVTDDY